MRKKIYTILCFLMIICIGMGLVKSLNVSEVAAVLPSKEVCVLNDLFVKSAETDEYIDFNYAISHQKETEILSLKTFWSSFQVLLNDNIIYDFHDEYKEKGAVRHWIEIPSSESNDLTLRLMKGNNYPIQVFDEKIFLGAKDAVLFEFVAENSTTFLISLLLFLTSVIIFISGIYLKKQLPKEYRGIEYLGGFALSASIWIITDSQILQLFTKHTACICFISFMTFMLMPVFIIGIIRETLILKSKIWDFLIAAYFIQIIWSVTCYITRITPLFTTLPGIHLLIIITVILIFKDGYREIYKYKNTEMKLIAIGILFFMAFSGTALILFYINPAYSYSYFYSIGLIIFMCCLIAAALKRAFDSIEKTALLNAYKDQAYVDPMVQMKNRAAYMKAQERDIQGLKLTYIVFDINNLKEVNDHYGHQEGDHFIIDCAKCIRQCFGNIGECYRIGGDEFVVIVEDLEEKEIKLLLKHFEDVLLQESSNKKYPLNIAYGYSIQQETTLNENEMFMKADQWMYIKKAEMKKRG